MASTRCGSSNCAFPKCGCMQRIKYDSHAQRQELRKKLIDKLNAFSEANGLSIRQTAALIGVDGANYNKIVKEAVPATIDSLLLYLHRLGLEFDIQEKGNDTGTIRTD